MGLVPYNKVNQSCATYPAVERDGSQPDEQGDDAAQRGPADVGGDAVGVVGGGVALLGDVVALSVGAEGVSGAAAQVPVPVGVARLPPPPLRRHRRHRALPPAQVHLG